MEYSKWRLDGPNGSGVRGSSSPPRTRIVASKTETSFVQRAGSNSRSTCRGAVALPPQKERRTAYRLAIPV
jgi:hypothetical protein